MRADQILRHFEHDLRAIHLARVRAVFATVRTLVRCGRLSLTSLGRAIAERTSPKHGIKRVDRLLGNPRLYAERLTFYRAIAQRVVGNERRPIVLVDWTSVTPKLWALVAAVPFDGRALMIYAETHPIARYMKPFVHARFLVRLAVVLPRACRPIVVTDAGFRSPWMKAVTAFGWDYVGRIRHGTVHHFGQGRTGFGPLWERTRTVPTDLGEHELGFRVRYRCRLVGIRKRGALLTPTSPKARHFQRDTGSKRQRRTALEPWILATSLRGSAAEVVAVYRRRMQIEETFRDTKSSRFGICLCLARTNSTARADLLLLLAALAHVAALLIGIAAERARLHLWYQANTVTARRVFSLVTLGRLVAASDPQLAGQALLAAPISNPLLTHFERSELR